MHDLSKVFNLLTTQKSFSGRLDGDQIEVIQSSEIGKGTGQVFTTGQVHPKVGESMNVVFLVDTDDGGSQMKIWVNKENDWIESDRLRLRLSPSTSPMTMTSFPISTLKPANKPFERTRLRRATQL